MFKSLLFIGGLVCSIGLGVNNVPVSNDLHYETNETIELKANPKLASYDDTSHIITLTADELNNYVFDNFYNELCTYTDQSLSDIFSLTYNNVNYTYDDGEIGLGNFAFVNDSYTISFNVMDTDNKFAYFFYDQTNDSDVALEFSSDLDIVFGQQSDYQGIKQAIELDISANSESMPQASDLFGYITQGATQFASALGTAFTSITAMIWDSTNSAPTFLGMVLLLSIGAGLIYLAFNIIRGLVRRLRG